MPDLTTLWQSLAPSILGKHSSWFWQMSEVVVLTITLVFIYYQVRLSRFTGMFETLTNMRNHWNSRAMMDFRRRTCENHLRNSKRILMPEGEVLGFFEDMGLLLRKGALDKEIIWNSYSYYIEHYWSILDPNIKEFRASSKDNTWYENFAELREQMRNYSIKKKAPSQDKSEAEIRKFIETELERQTQEQPAGA